jgi:hypothetical protein
MNRSTIWADTETVKYVATGGDVQESAYPASAATARRGTVAVSWYVALAHLALSGTWTCPEQTGPVVSARPSLHLAREPGGMNFPAASVLCLCPAQRTVRAVPRPPGKRECALPLVAVRKRTVRRLRFRSGYCAATGITSKGFPPSSRPTRSGFCTRGDDRFGCQEP